jgi:HK97 family phage major capsid protein
VDEVPTSGAAATNLTFGQERLPIHTVMAETTLSRNLIEDAAFPLEAYLARKFAEAAAIDEDNQFLTGDGNGKPQGVLPGSANGLSLTEVNSGNANYLTFDGLIGLTFGLSAQYRQNAVFVAEKATWRDIAKLQDTKADKGQASDRWTGSQQIEYMRYVEARLRELENRQRECLTRIEKEHGK